MPNRIIKESICCSETIDELSWFEEVLFYRLIVNCDDYGRTDGRAKMLKANLFPLKNVTERQITEAINSLQSVGIVQVYKYDRRPYLQIVNWSKHQSIRNKRSKYPSPDDDLQTIEINCNQLNTNASLIQSESESEYESESINAKPQKHKYGEYQNVLLSDADMEKLKTEFPSDWQERIERLSEGIASKGYKYKNHLATIRSWAKRDKKQESQSDKKTRGINNFTDINNTDYTAIEDKLLDMMLED